MKKNGSVTLIGVALIGALAIGTASVAFAAPSRAATTPVRRAGACIGATVRQSGGTVADMVAKLTGRPVEDVRATRATKSFADQVAPTGVSAEKLTADALAARKAGLDAAVEAGTISQEQADIMLANMTTRISASVTTTGACTGTGAGGGGGRGGRGMGRGAGSCATVSQP